jgi:alpha-L-rhamnosidase
VSAVLVRVSSATFEHHTVALGCHETRPRVSWKLTAPAGWTQIAYQIELTRPGRLDITGRIESAEQLLVAWPFLPLVSREAVTVRVRVWGDTGAPSDWSPAASFEVGLILATDWRARGIASAWAEDSSIDNPPPLMRSTFTSTGAIDRARLYVTAHGLAEIEINGVKAGDQTLLPGWTVYPKRLRVAAIDVTDLIQDGDNGWGARLADGWHRGRLGFDGGYRNVYGDELALLAQLEVIYTDGTTLTVGTDGDWTASVGPITLASLYDGERYDAARAPIGWSSAGFDDSTWSAVKVTDFDLNCLTGYDGPAVSCTDERRPSQVTKLGPERYLVDFGQNLVGRLRITVDGRRGTTVRLSHAEVLQDGELYRRTLRDAESIDEYTLAGLGAPETWEPTFTMHGFRYAEIDGWVGGPIEDNVVARVYHSDMERTGWFECSDELVNRLHQNVVWSMRGNFVDLPTDCPQRDERFGWTGDIQVFAPTASFLFDCSGLLASWLKDVAAEQLPDGTIPWYVPVVPGGDQWTPIRPAALWGDVAVLTPWTLWENFADHALLERQYDSAKQWVDLVARLSGTSHLWNTGMQLGDWLDPAAPPDDPAGALTDRYLVATAYAAWSASKLSQTAAVLGRTADEAKYASLAEAIRLAFVREYVNQDGTLTSDAATAYSLAIVFQLLPADLVKKAGERLSSLVADGNYTIPTGFAGTNVISEALSLTGHTPEAYRLLLQRESPSWLYAVVMGATTIWERWDSMLPDGTVNSGGMTSFNHYALGAVADWLHRRVAGLESLEPGWRRVRFRPEPGGGLTWASARHVSPYGETSIRWELRESTLVVDISVPTGTTGSVELPGTVPAFLGSGRHHFETQFVDAEYAPTGLIAGSVQ